MSVEFEIEYVESVEHVYLLNGIGTLVEVK